MTTQKELPVLPEPIVWKFEPYEGWWPEPPTYNLYETAVTYSADQLQAYGQQCASHARDQAISETLSIAYGYADSLTWNDDFKAEIEALKGK